MPDELVQFNKYLKPEDFMGLGEELMEVKKKRKGGKV